MARRRQSELDELFDMWARWCVSGGARMASAQTPLAKWMAGRGHVVFGAGGCAPTDTVEERIEASVVTISVTDPMTALVLRYEYGVWSTAGEWRGQEDHALTQADKARALGVSLRTYRRRLADGRARVEKGLAQ